MSFDHPYSGAFIIESNGLSQFNEDTGGPSVPVQEFNIIACLLAYVAEKPLPDLDLNPGRREPLSRQASRHCGATELLIHLLTYIFTYLFTYLRDAILVVSGVEATLTDDFGK